MWVKNGLIRHSYFEKAMRTLMKKSYMGVQQKMDVLSKMLRLSVVGKGVTMEEKVEIVDHYTQKLVNSGYERKMIKEIIVSGLRGFMNKVPRRKFL